MSFDKTGIIIRIVREHDYENVVKFIIDYYYRDEPLCSTEPKIQADANNRADNMECLKAGVSLMAVKVNGNGEEELVGINLGVPHYPTSADKYFKLAERDEKTKYGQILKLIAVANHQSDIFKYFGVDKVLYSYLSCIKPSYRGQNLGTRLKEELMALGARQGYELISVDCSSFYSARLCKRMGWEVVNFICYKDYKDENGQQIFSPPPPHEGLTTLAVRL